MRRPTLAALAALLLPAACDSPTDSAEPAALRIAAPSGFVEVGQTLLLSAAATDASGRELAGVPVRWTSRDPAVAEVRDGLVTGRAPGAVTIVATAGSAADSLRVTVEPPSVGELVVLPDTLYLPVGRGARLFVEVRDRSGRPLDQPLVFASSAPGVAAVDGAGAVATFSTGAAVVSVTAGLRSAHVPVLVGAGARYAAVSLGSLGGAAPDSAAGALSVVADLSERGEVVGGAVTATGEWHAFLWRAGRMRDLGAPPGRRWSTAVAVNNRGMVVGNTLAPERTHPWRPLGESRAWAWSAGAFTLADTLHAFATDVNEGGEMVGYLATEYYTTVTMRGFLWRQGAMRRDIETGRHPELPLGFGAAAGAINASGAVALSYQDQPTPLLARAALLARGVLTHVPQPHPAAVRWYATDLSDAGLLLGEYVTVDGRVAGFLWDGARATDLAPMRGAALNEHGEVVGGPYLRRGGQTVDLRGLVDAPELEVIAAVGINDLGWIVADGRERATGRRVALLLRPAT